VLDIPKDKVKGDLEKLNDKNVGKSIELDWVMKLIADEPLPLVLNFDKDGTVERNETIPEARYWGIVYPKASKDEE